MYFEFVSDIDNFRKDLINLGQTLGTAFQALPKETPWIVCLNGDPNSGKSLIPLAIDSVFTPDRYPCGITPDLNADKLISDNVVFNNFLQCVCHGRDAFDLSLNLFTEKNIGTKVLVAANLKRTIRGNFNFQAKGLDSDLLDVSIMISKIESSENWNSGIRIGLTIEDKAFIKILREKDFISSNSSLKQTYPIALNI